MLDHKDILLRVFGSLGPLRLVIKVHQASFIIKHVFLSLQPGFMFVMHNKLNAHREDIAGLLASHDRQFSFTSVLLNFIARINILGLF